jgi:hypothetical protein
MIKRYTNYGIDMLEVERGDYVKYEDYVALERSIESRKITDCAMPPRIENIHLRSPKEVENMWRHRVKWLCAQFGVKVHDN